jgi:8-oxo-dGTP pyrophosphatase MutT (NUDIX family)/phosphohistidine phosphatase SixA
VTASPAPDVRAAGVVVFRPGRRVLLVHRPKYDDWSFPKGKLDRGEHSVAAAVREVSEETGLHVRLCLPLTDQRYPVVAGRKTVHYWAGRVVGDDDVSGYRPNAEIDGVRWVEAEEADDLLSYDHDRTTLAEALLRRRRTRVIVVLRHSRARSRGAWRRDDAERPLLRLGEVQAERLVPLLAAYGVTRLVSSTSRRCVQTLDPYVRTTGWELQTRRRLSEEGASPAGVRKVVTDLLEETDNAVLCTHRPVLPEVFTSLGLKDPGLDPGEMVVVHLRKGKVAGTERHLVR